MNKWLRKSIFENYISDKIVEMLIWIASSTNKYIFLGGNHIAACKPQIYNLGKKYTFAVYERINENQAHIMDLFN